MPPREPNVTWLGETPAIYSYTSSGAVYYPNLTYLEQQRMVREARRDRIRQTRPPPLSDHLVFERLRMIEEQRARRAAEIERRTIGAFPMYPRGRGARGDGGTDAPGRGNTI